MAMTLQSLLFCPDEKTVRVLKRVLTDLEIGVLHCTEVEEAREKAKHQRFDAIIVDCEDEAAATAVLERARSSPVNETALAVALADGQTSLRSAFSLGATFVLYKPISMERARSSLRAARGLMQRERRGSLRVPVQVLTSISYKGSNKSVRATMVDLSDAGAAIRTKEPLRTTGPIMLRFTLPKTTSSLQATGEVIWGDTGGRFGVRFVDMPQNSRQVLKDWLSAHTKGKEEGEAAVKPEARTMPEAAVEAGVEAGEVHVLRAERRGYARHSCHVAVELFKESSASRHRCTLTDISMAGCYLQTDSPFVARSRLELLIRVQDAKVRVKGLVRVMHPNFGMGVEFAQVTAEQRRRMEELIDVLRASANESPGLLLPAGQSADGGDAGAPGEVSPESDVDPLLQLFGSKEVLTREGFLEELKKLRAPKPVVSER